MSLISDADKAALSAVLHSGVQTWFRPLTVWQEAQTTVIVSDPNWNPYTAYGQNQLDVQNTPVTSIVSGAILWSKDQEWRFVSPGGVHPSQLKVKDATKQACRLKVDDSGRALLSTAKKVRIDGVEMVPDTEPRPHGLFGVDRYTLYFVRG